MVAFAMLAAALSGTCLGVGRYETQECPGIQQQQFESGLQFGEFGRVAWKGVFSERRISIGPSATPRRGDSNPECGSAGRILGFWINRPSNCATFCFDSVDQAYWRRVEFYMVERDGARIGSCDDRCEFAWASIRKTGYACAEFRNWSDDRVRVAVIRIVHHD